MILGISGVATSGKDTLFLILQKNLANKGIVLKRAALADQLKIDLMEFCEKHIGINILKASSEEKRIIRGLMVSYGKIKREQTRGKHWTSLLQKEIDFNLKNNIIPVVTDIRYAEYEEDELHWLKKMNNGVLVHVSRILQNGDLLPPANEEEAINDPILKKNADFKFCWNTISENTNIYDEASWIISSLSKIL